MGVGEWTELKAIMTHRVAKLILRLLSTPTREREKAEVGAVQVHPRNYLTNQLLRLAAPPFSTFCGNVVQIFQQLVTPGYGWWRRVGGGW